MLEVDVDRQHEFLAVEERAGGDLDADDPALQLEGLHTIRPGALIVLEHLDHVLAVFVLPHEQELLDVLRLAARLDDIAVGVRAHESERVIERMKILLRDDRHAGLLELLLSKGAVVLELVRVGTAAHHQLAGLPQLVCLRPLAQDVVEHDDVGPRHVADPVVGLGDEAVGDLALLLRLDEQLDLVALFDDLPRDVGDQAVERNEQELLLIQGNSGV